MTTTKDKIDDFIKMVRLRERQEVSPDAKVVRDGKTYDSLEAYMDSLMIGERLNELSLLAEATADRNGRETWEEWAFRVSDYLEGRIKALQADKEEANQ